MLILLPPSEGKDVPRRGRPLDLSDLSFPDLAIASLERLIPDRATRILIYCNNNFRNAEGPFPAKLASASLNLSTYITLYTYGYRNVYELAPLIDPANSRLAFEGSLLAQRP